ncbi:hypothetical protein ONZ43_g6912 [Nemania bipapillata]|uniref:Uncharacterized protein n=1 Tax=Nemania bipapillata TaxID=110536 RepID=A0ACC2HUW6_9PEZI|nr:hypothetical protein ONZ43_g6912 [Nemania bipapillata]
MQDVASGEAVVQQANGEAAGDLMDIDDDNDEDIVVKGEGVTVHTSGVQESQAQKSQVQKSQAQKSKVQESHVEESNVQKAVDNKAANLQATVEDAVDESVTEKTADQESAGQEANATDSADQDAAPLVVPTPIIINYARYCRIYGVSLRYAQNLWSRIRRDLKFYPGNEDAVITPDDRQLTIILQFLSCVDEMPKVNYDQMVKLAGIGRRSAQSYVCRFKKVIFIGLLCYRLAAESQA